MIWIISGPVYDVYRNLSLLSWVPVVRFFFQLQSNTSCRGGGPPPGAHNWLVLTGWHRRNPSGRRCGPWRGQKLPSSRLGGCTGTRWGCSAVGCRPGSWGRYEHYQGRETVWKQWVPVCLVFLLVGIRSCIRENCIVNNKKKKHIHLWLRR